MACTGATVLFVMTLILAWGAFGLGVSSVGAKTWYWTKVNYSGLWVACIDDSTCATLAASPTLNAIRSLVIIGIALGFLGIILFQSSFWRRKGGLSVASVGFALLLLGALSWTAAMVVHTISYSADVTAWGYSYYFGWGCVGFLNLAGIFAIAAINSKKNSQVDIA